jgi:cytochrome c oxidase subunit IV
MHEPPSQPDLSGHGAIHGHGPADAHEDHAGHGIAKYLYVFGALTLLTTASFMTYTDLWRNNIRSEAAGWTFMMAVSCTKALLVMLFFMHLKYEASWKYVLTIPASVMAIFLMFALVPDVKWRYPRITGGRQASDERREHAYQPGDGDPTLLKHKDAAHGD